MKRKTKLVILESEPARDRMERWVAAGVTGDRLAALGVPMNLMLPAQQDQARRAFPVGAMVEIN